MRYGFFSKDEKEYIITRPDTPTPWINYIGEGAYGGIVTNTGGGYSFYKDPRYRRILRYRYNNLPMDRPGRYIYLRDESDGHFWSPTWQPTMTKLQKYECRHGMGYTKITGLYRNISAEITYFVPVKQDFEYWLVKVKNENKHSVKLKLFTYAEFCLFDAVTDQQDVDWAQQVGQGHLEDRTIFWTSFMKTEGYAYFATSEKIESYDTDREKFIGLYHSETNPTAVINGECSNSRAHRGNGCASFCHELHLKPGQEKEIVFQLGYAKDTAQALRRVKRFHSLRTATNEFKKLAQHWQKYVSKLEVKTPDEEFNRLVNVWNQYQCRTTFNWSRFVSMYQLGVRRGMGFRDSSQDTLGVMHTIPEEAKKLIIKLLKNQFKEGDAYHQYFPLTGEGDTKGYSDDHLWIIFAVTSYLKETGDLAFLKKDVPFADNNGQATVYEHLKKAVEYSLTHIGPHGLPLAGFADWNDTINLDRGQGQAESVMVAQLLGKALLDLEELALHLGNQKEAQKFAQDYLKIKALTNKHCWDGRWYLRAFDDNGRKLGAKICHEGKIFLETQAWGILSRFAENDRARKISQSVKKLLDTKYGIMLEFPGYTRFDSKKGGVSTYPPGAKENAGIFLHANTWMIIAETLLGNCELAYQYYKQLSPNYRNDIAEIYEIEPYVYSQNILGREHPLFGLGRNSWLSGTASWALVASTQHILGLKPAYGGLLIDPCIPKNWPVFVAKRIFRAAEYNIIVRNPKKTAKGVKEILVDGKKLKGNLIPVFKKGTKHKVEVILG